MHTPCRVCRVLHANITHYITTSYEYVACVLRPFGWRTLSSIPDTNHNYVSELRRSARLKSGAKSSSEEEAERGLGVLNLAALNHLKRGGERDGFDFDELVRFAAAFAARETRGEK